MSPTTTRQAVYGFNGTSVTGLNGFYFGASTVFLTNEIIVSGSGDYRLGNADGSMPNINAGSPCMFGIRDGNKLDYNGLDVSTTSGTFESVSNVSYRLGDLILGATSSDFDGKIAELVSFSSVTTAAQHDRIQSYLAIKYGITMDNSAGGTSGDYVASDGTLIWDASVNPGYHNDVIGIGRDDNQELNQKQSHAYDDTTRIYLSTLEATNAANTGSFTNDISYVTIGHDQGQVCATAASLAEMPGCTALYSRLEREWKVTKTNLTQTFQIDISLNGCGAPASVDVSHLRLLVDDDGDFLAGTNCYSNGNGTGIVISYSSPIITVSNISNTHIPNNSTRYITIGSEDLTTPLPIELVEFTATPNENQTVFLDWITQSEINNDYFVVERSRNGLDWEELFYVPAAGNSSTTLNYSELDNSPYMGTSYYRLRQTDFDGTFTYSNIESVNFAGVEIVTIFPNPGNGNFNLIINSTLEGTAKIKAYDKLGRVVYNQETELEKGFNEMHESISNLSTGIYTLRVEMQDGMYYDNELITIQ